MPKDVDDGKKRKKKIILISVLSAVVVVAVCVVYGLMSGSFSKVSDEPGKTTQDEYGYIDVECHFYTRRNEKIVPYCEVSVYRLTEDAKRLLKLWDVYRKDPNINTLNAWSSQVTPTIVTSYEGDKSFRNGSTRFLVKSGRYVVEASATYGSQSFMWMKVVDTGESVLLTNDSSCFIQ